ncbi:hypothetical protein TomMM35A_10900 [Sphingobium sp. TomMM35A]
MRPLDGRQADKCDYKTEKETGRETDGPRPSSLCSVHQRNGAFSPCCSYSPNHLAAMPNGPIVQVGADDDASSDLN